MPETETAATPDGMVPSRHLIALRVAIGFAQGVTLALLVGPMYPPEWTRSLGIVWEPLLLAAIGVPILLIGGTGHMRWKPLLIWAAVAAVVLASLGLHDALRVDDSPGDLYRNERIPSPLLLLFCVPGLFVAHHLVAAADADRSLIARYPTYFEIGWTSATQIALAGALIGAMWIVLMLGGALFGAVGVYALQDLLREPLVVWPVTCVTFAMGVQLTGDRAAMVRTVRTLGLGLLSWLMPVMTAFVVLFLMALPFTGLSPLWRTGSATPILLSSAAVIVALVNAAYQDGDPDAPPARFLATVGLVARVTVLPLVLLAGVSTWMRIDQYGLTPDRIAAAVATLIALVYASGYFLSVLPPYRARRMLESTNIAAACVGLLAWIAVFSPIADPARISVDDQVARLLSGRIAPAKFDFGFLRWDSARYGREALGRLAETTEGPDAERIAEMAGSVLSSLNRYDSSPALTLEERISVWPQGLELPSAFVQQTLADQANRRNGAQSECFQRQDQTCDAILVDLDGDAVEEILLVNIREPRAGEPQHFWSASYIEVFRLNGAAWEREGSYDPPCRGEVEALRQGKAAFAPRQGHDLMLNGQRLPFQRNYDDMRRCPPN